MRFPRQEYWNGLPFPSLGDRPNPRIEPVSSALAGGFFTTEPPGKSHEVCYRRPNCPSVQSESEWGGSSWGTVMAHCKALKLYRGCPESARRRVQGEDPSSRARGPWLIIELGVKIGLWMVRNPTHSHIHHLISGRGKSGQSGFSSRLFHLLAVWPWTI